MTAPSNPDQDGWEGDVEFPPCPVCKEGRMLPLSMQGRPYCVWVCNAPGCAYVVSFSGLAVTYYKGTAVVTSQRKDGKIYDQFSF